ncbi:MAG: DUF4250 domain-containing protein [Lachnospiraceae bacterium]
MIPEEPSILLSYVNTLLRDFYPTLDEFCDAMDCSKEDIIEKLKSIDYEYEPDLNKFV